MAGTDMNANVHMRSVTFMMLLTLMAHTTLK